MASTHIYRACDATASSGYSNKWTWSGWVKRSKLGTTQGIFMNKKDDSNSNSRFKLQFQPTDKLAWECKDSSASDDSSFETNMLFRDTNAWYHIVLIYDSDNSTATERIKCYVNGKDVRTELGGFASDNQASSGFGTLWSSASRHFIGVSCNNSGTDYWYDGLMSHCHLTYGHRYEASTFGSTDTTTGEWEIATSPSVTYGSQGYFMLKDDNSLNDDSGEGNNFTLGNNALTKTKDCPSNVFATFNGAFNLSDIVLSEGNTKTFNSNSNWKYVPTTLGVSSGKYYCEYKITINGGYIMLGVCDMQYATSQDQNSYTHVGAGTGGVGLYDDNGEKYLQGSNTAHGAVYGTNDIVSIALDMDNNKVYFAKNGDWATGSGAWGSSTFNSSTGAITLPTTGGTYAFASSIRSSASLQANFGNGYFGTTAVATNSGNGYAGAEGASIFNYQPPTGYSALSTKGLNQ